jgi:hypothetical protein
LNTGSLVSNGTSFIAPSTAGVLLGKSNGNLALWLRNTKDNVEKSVRRTAIATEKSTRTLGDIRSSSGTNESNVNSAIDEVSKKQRLA